MRFHNGKIAATFRASKEKIGFHVAHFDDAGARIGAWQTGAGYSNHNHHPGHGDTQKRVIGPGRCADTKLNSSL
jgi:hypothetical protein